MPQEIEELEPEMEAFLARFHPKLGPQLRGATAAEIQRIEEIAGRPLPRFYRWFLQRMGTDMGPLSFRRFDYSASKILDCYARGVVAPDRRFLLIGYGSEDVGPVHRFYDFDYQARHDARVAEGENPDDEMNALFETFREMIAWGELMENRLYELPQRCQGFFIDPGGEVRAQLDPVMVSLGFRTPIPTGPCCALFDGAHAALAMTTDPSDYNPGILFFNLAGGDAQSLRRLLGEITRGSSLEVEIRKWLPPLQ